MSIIVVPVEPSLPHLWPDQPCPEDGSYAKVRTGKWYVCWRCWFECWKVFNNPPWRLSQDSPRTAPDGSSAWEWRAGATGTHDGHWHRGEG